jgi:hypothetical protein
MNQSPSVVAIEIVSIRYLHPIGCHRSKRESCLKPIDNQFIRDYENADLALLS